MYSRSTLHLVGKLSLVWDVVGTVHLSPRDVVGERTGLANRVLFEQRRFKVNELKEKGSAEGVGGRVDMFA